MNHFLAYSLTFLVAFLVSLILTPFTRHVAVKYNYVAVPRDDRWPKKTTGLFGGVSIFISLMAAWVIGSFVFARYSTAIQPLLPVALGGAAIGSYAIGGGAWGVHALGANAKDQQLLEFFKNHFGR